MCMMRLLFNYDGYVFITAVDAELLRARGKHPKRFNSAHEGLAVIEEEFEEFKKEVFHGTKQRTREELVQLAAMCIRFAEDLP